MAVQERGLDEIGLGRTARIVLYLISLLPFVGLVIGLNYAFRRNAATRILGWRLLFFALALHALYFFCICPVALIWALSR